MVSIPFVLLASISPIIFIGGGLSWESRKENYNAEETFGRETLDYNIGTVFGYGAGTAVDIKYWEYPVSTEVGVKYIVGGYHDEYSPIYSELQIPIILKVKWETIRDEVDIYAKVKYNIILNTSISILPNLGYARSYLLSTLLKTP